MKYLYKIFENFDYSGIGRKKKSFQLDFKDLCSISMSTSSSFSICNITRNTSRL